MAVRKRDSVACFAGSRNDATWYANCCTNAAWQYRQVCEAADLLNFTFPPPALLHAPHALHQESLIKTDTTLPDSDACHIVRFYDDEQLMLAEVAAFISSALPANGAGIVIATPEHGAALRKTLGDGGARVRFLDAADTLARLLVDGWPMKRAFAP